jgi:hypothetical protein
MPKAPIRGSRPSGSTSLVTSGGLEIGSPSSSGVPPPLAVHATDADGSGRDVPGESRRKPQRSRTSFGDFERETQTMMVLLASRSSSERMVSRWSGTPSSTFTSQVPQ